MKRKIVGILVVGLLIATAVLPVIAIVQCGDISVKGKVISGDAADLDFNQIVASGDEIDQQQTSDCGYGRYFYGSYWCAQGFVPSLEILTRIQLQWFRAGSPPENLNIMVRIRDSLTGEDFTTVSVKGSQIQGYYVWLDFDVPDISVNPGTKYYIVCSVDECFECDSSNYYAWYFEINNPYDKGKAWISSNYGNAGSWSVLSPSEFPDMDFCFITYGKSNSAPNAPSISGSTSGKAGEEHEYTFSATDPDGDDVTYVIDWGDNSGEEGFGPYPSGEQTTAKHSWEEGDYTLKAKAVDTYDKESDWATLEVSMPRNKPYINTPFLRFLENHPRMFPLLQKLLELK